MVERNVRAEVMEACLDDATGLITEALTEIGPIHKRAFGYAVRSTALVLFEGSNSPYIEGPSEWAMGNDEFTDFAINHGLEHYLNEITREADLNAALGEPGVAARAVAIRVQLQKQGLLAQEDSEVVDEVVELLDAEFDRGARSIVRHVHGEDC